MVPRLRTSALAVALLLVVAGCAGFDPLGEQAVGSPPGVENGTITNHSALVSAHVTELTERGFVLTTRDGRIRYAAEPGFAAFCATSRQSAREREYSLWGNETMAIAREYDTNDGTSSYWLLSRRQAMRAEEVGFDHHAERYSRTRYTGANVLDFARHLTFNRTGTTECGATQCLVLRGQGRDPDANASARMLVDDRGVVHEFELAFTTSHGRRVHVYVRLVRLGGVSVERPDWVERGLRVGNPG